MPKFDESISPVRLTIEFISIVLGVLLALGQRNGVPDVSMINWRVPRSRVSGKK